MDLLNLDLNLAQTHHNKVFKQFEPSHWHHMKCWTSSCMLERIKTFQSYLNWWIIRSISIKSQIDNLNQIVFPLWTEVSFKKTCLKKWVISIMTKISTKPFNGLLRYLLVPTPLVVLDIYQHKKEVQKEVYLNRCNRRSKSSEEWTTQWILVESHKTWLIHSK